MARHITWFIYKVERLRQTRCKAIITADIEKTIQKETATVPSTKVMGSSHHLCTILVPSGTRGPGSRKECLSFWQKKFLPFVKVQESCSTWSQDRQEQWIPGKRCSIKKALASTIFRVHTYLPDTTARLWAHAVNTRGSGRFLEGLTESQVLIHLQAENGAAGDTAPVLSHPIKYTVLE